MQRSWKPLQGSRAGCQHHRTIRLRAECSANCTGKSEMSARLQNKCASRSKSLTSGTADGTQVGAKAQPTDVDLERNTPALQEMFEERFQAARDEYFLRLPGSSGSPIFSNKD